MYYYQPGINKNQRIVYSEELHNRFENNIFSTINEIKNMDRNEEYDEC